MSRRDAPVVAAMVMSASRSRSDRVEASSTTRMVRASSGRLWGSVWARYQATVSHSIPVAAARVRVASPFTAAPTTRYPAVFQASAQAATVVVLPAPARPIAVA